MKESVSYLGIDLEETGNHLKNLIMGRGYTVKEIQNILHLSCPQPIHRWFKGQILPSVDHLYVLSKLLRVHMEELLLPAQEDIVLYEYRSDALLTRLREKTGREYGHFPVSKIYGMVLSKRMATRPPAQDTPPCEAEEGADYCFRGKQD